MPYPSALTGPVTTSSSTGTSRVAVIPERYGRVFSPCASIRLQSFFDVMQRDDRLEMRYVLPSELGRFNPDLIVWHRVSMSDPCDLETISRVAAISGAKLVYDLDDNLLDLEGHGERGSYDAMRGSVRASLAIADEVWASTPMLSERVARESRASVQVLPNALDPNLWGLPREHVRAVRSERTPLRVLYMGTRTHDADFILLRDALDLVHREQPGSFQMSMIGVRSAASDLPPWLRSLDPPAHVGASYPAFVAWFSHLTGFDLGVAPLLSSGFNDCKSPIKVLDYAAIGLPTLASKVPAYADALLDGVNCHLVENNVEAWASAVRTLSHHRDRLTAVIPGAAALVEAEVFAQAVQARLRRLLALSRHIGQEVSR